MNALNALETAGYEKKYFVLGTHTQLDDALPLSFYLSDESGQEITKESISEDGFTIFYTEDSANSAKRELVLSESKVFSVVEFKELPNNLKKLAREMLEIHSQQSA
jgi:hypothetical protein